MPQITLTPINPKRLNAGAMRAQLLLGLKTLGLEIRDDFEATVETWKDKPTFEPFSAEPVVKGDKATVESIANHQVYSWVSKGTKPHKIVPKNYSLLIFPSVFSAKTVPGTILANPGFSGPPMEIRGKEGVWHPGVDPREFDKHIKDKQLPRAKTIMKLAMSSARRVSGHAFP